MNWEAVAAISELVGAAGVIASLIYLSIQIRHNSRQVDEQTRALNAASLEAIEAAFSRWRQPIASSEQAASVWRRCLEDFESLSADEQTQASAMLQELCWSWVTTLFRTTSGDFTGMDAEVGIKNLLAVLRNPGARQWWDQNSEEYPDNFVALVESRIAGSR
jgi:hypothetical protein